MGRYWVRGEAQRPAAEACVSGRKRLSAHLVASVLEEVSPGLEVIRFAAPWRPAASHTQIRGEKKWRAKTGNSGIKEQEQDQDQDQDQILVHVNLRQIQVNGRIN